ncbi:DUF5615 family PIN-like protein [Halobacterium wangiae]|uniref:DUF5615 family PIN-like protein n=1 Tax=Halobacterium wangiae TaxID=2902623 RepID=UPI001E32F815|nr:DUF5615 family PIN-like protein [Halobacterium wangiae]
MAFLVDAMCGDLARLLRMCGHDAVYVLDRGIEDDDEVRRLAVDEDRTLVTRDRDLAARTPESVLVVAKDTDEQLRELAAVGVTLEPAAGERCGACNGELEDVPAGADLPEYVADDADPVWRCRDCGQFFWRGSHWTDVERRLEEL